MLKEKGNSSSNSKLDEAKKSPEDEERVDLEDGLEEEVEYEEIEEEVEEEVEEEEEEIEEEIEEEVEEEEEDEDVDEEAQSPVEYAGRKKTQDNVDGISSESDRNEMSRTHSDLLALPPHGSEIFVGGIPRNASQEELKKFCESAGKVYEVRIMKDKNSKENKGYAFVTFMTKELAEKAIDSLNNTEFKGRKVKCSKSQQKNRLYIGNIPRNWMKRDLEKTVIRMGPGVIKVEVLKDPQNSECNRGFGFVEYYNHACADYSRIKLSTRFEKEDTALRVSWAASNSEDTDSSQVKAIYVKNLPKNVTEKDLRQIFEHHGEITRVVLPPAKPGMEKTRFGFVHFADRMFAVSAVESTEKYKLQGQILDCSLAKPPERKSESGPSNQQAALLPSFQPHFGFGLQPYGGALGSGYGAAGFAPHMMYGGAQIPGGMAMVPMLLPDGRLGYVLQQQPGSQLSAPAPQPRKSNRGDGGGASSSRQNYDDNRGGRRYRPY